MDHEKSVVAMIKDLQLPQRMFHSEPVRSNPALLQLKRKILRELARWNSLQATTVRWISCVAPPLRKARRHIGVHQSKSENFSDLVALCQSLLHHESAIDSMSQRIGSESGFERIGDWLLGLESF